MMSSGRKIAERFFTRLLCSLSASVVKEDLTTRRDREHDGDMGIEKLLVIPKADRLTEIGRLLRAEPFTLGSFGRIRDLLRSLGVEKL